MLFEYFDRLRFLLFHYFGISCDYVFVLFETLVTVSLIVWMFSFRSDFDEDSFENKIQDILWGDLE